MLWKISTVAMPTEHKLRFYGSPNRMDWTQFNEFGPVGATGGVWECPDLFELPVNGTNEKRWVLVVNHNPGSVASGSSGQYFIGQFDGTRFTADADSPFKTAPNRASESALWFDYGPEYHAADSWSDIPKSAGGRLWLGWMSNWDYAQDVPTSPWRSAMSIPREMGLRKTAEGIRLVQKPGREMERLRGEHRTFSAGDIAGANGWLAKEQIKGDQLEIVVEFAAAVDGGQGLKVLQSGKEATVIGVDGTRGTVLVDRTQSGNVSFHPKFPGVYEAPLASPNEPVTLHVFVDASSVEVFVNNGEQVITAQVFPSASSRGVEFFGSSSGATIESINVWKLKSCL
ncbi:MAG: GH32 C-terminal domain-containing protein [Verrucomicrobiae bacterium]|nr:GH32 C-terminal domain-containing protein [Verrucomicrobiae bacterium]